MKRVFAVNGRAALLDVAEPTLRSGEVLVEPAFSAISTGTETAIIRSTAPDASALEQTHRGLHPDRPKLRSDGVRLPFAGPRPEAEDRAALGYSLAGTVIATADDVTDITPGSLVACSGNQCSFHAERVTVPRSLVAPIPPGVSLEQAAFVTLGTVAMHGLRRTNCRFGETVVIYGLGLLGLLAIQIARSAGLYTIGLDIDNRRLAQAHAFGSQAALNPREADADQVIRDLTDGYGADAVLMCVYTDSSEPLNHAFDLCRQRARVVGIGAFGMDISRERMYARDVAFYPSIAYGPGRYDPVFEEGNVDFPIGYVRWTESRNMAAFLRLVAEGKVEVQSLAPVRIPFHRALEAYDLLHSPDRPPTVLLTYERAQQ